MGDYCTGFDPAHMVTVLDGIRQLAGEETEVGYEKGCSYLGERIVPFHPGWFRSEEGGSGLTGRYYNGWEMEGEPVVTRVDPMIQFNWILCETASRSGCQPLLRGLDGNAEGAGELRRLHRDFQPGQYAALCGWRAGSGQLGRKKGGRIRLNFPSSWGVSMRFAWSFETTPGGPE